MDAKVGFTDVTRRRPLRTVSVIVLWPAHQPRSSWSRAATASRSAEVALKVTDSQTGQLLAAAIDRRGGGAVSRRPWQWGDVQPRRLWTQRFAENGRAARKAKAAK
jgi:hypothetical protein